MTKLTGHPFQRIYRQLFNAAVELCEQLVDVTLPSFLPPEEVQNCPSFDNAFAVTSSPNASGTPVGFLPTSPLCVIDKLPMNSATTTQCFQRNSIRGFTYESVLVIRVAVTFESAVGWTRSSLNNISCSWCENQSNPESVDLVSYDGKRTVFCTSPESSSQCVAFVLSPCHSSESANETFICFFLNRLAVCHHGLSDPVVLECDDPRLLREESALKLPLSLHPREFLTDMSFWLPTDKSFDVQSFRDAAFALSDGTLRSCDLLEQYERPSDGRVSHCYRLIFQCFDRALCQGTMHQLQSKLRLFSRDNFDVELR